ncbi:MAG: UbiA family prenyltransferase [Nanoarchaeota archaeon]|nr:UbiA family prenyltransferase [Nanoarchaeota archaeon]
MTAFLTILRPANALMAVLAVFVGGLITMQATAFSSLSLGLALLAAFLITGAGNVINDYVDIEADKINKPKRPIPSGRISPKGALTYAITLFLVGIALASQVNLVVLLIAVINSLVLIGYAITLKQRALVGHLAVSYLVGSTFLFGGAVAGNLKLTLILALLAGLANFSREIIKALEDVEGDRAHFLKRMVKKVRKEIASRFKLKGDKVELTYGKRVHLTLATLSLLLAILISLIPLLLHILNESYLIPVMLADVVFIAAMIRFLRAKKPKDYRKASKWIKYGMFLGLIAFIVGALV